MKVLDYDGLKQVVAKIKSLIDLKASKVDLNNLLNSLKIQDTRNANENPLYYMKNKGRSVYEEFKLTAKIGIGDSSSEYCALVTIIPWSDSSGGYPMQTAFLSNSDKIYTRRGASDTAWGKWRRVLDENDVKTRLSQFIEDSTHRTVTDTEKSTWNSKLSKLIGENISRSKTKGYNTNNTWQSLSTTRDLEDWIGDFDKRTRENKANIVSESRIRQIAEQAGMKESKVREIAAEYTYPEIIYSNTTNLGEVLNQSFNTSFYNIKNLDNITSSSSSMKELCNNEGAISLALKSDRFLNKVINSNLAMHAIANSEKAMKIAAQSRFAVRKFFSSTAAKYQIFDSDTAILALLDGPYITKLDKRGYSVNITGTRIFQGFPLAASQPSARISKDNKSVYDKNSTRSIYYKGTSLYVLANDKMAEVDFVNVYEPYKDDTITYVLDLDKL